jgi:hypothetical protein
MYERQRPISSPAPHEIRRLVGVGVRELGRDEVAVSAALGDQLVVGAALDQPARIYLAAHGVLGRAELVAGSFFEMVLAGSDAYAVRGVRFPAGTGDGDGEPDERDRSGGGRLTPCKPVEGLSPLMSYGKHSDMVWLDPVDDGVVPAMGR